MVGSNFSIYMRYGKLVAVVLVLLALGTLRFLNLSADTPAGMSGSAALYVDEGYKTLTARNIVVFSEPRWNPADDYPGWMKNSPLTHWLYYRAFELFGPTVESARLVTIGFFLFFLGSYAAGLYRRYESWLFFAGFIILGLESTIFFFSRVALLELPLAAFVYAMIFAFARLDQRRTLVRIFMVLSLSIFLTLLVKRSALLYLIPVLAAVAFPLAARTESLVRPRMWLYLLVAAAVVGSLLLFTANVWGGRVAVDPLAVLAGLLMRNPLVEVSPIIVLLGLFCALHGILAQPSMYLQDPYRISVLSIIILTPVILAFFPYGPLRYYFPILPAYILIILEWINSRGWALAPSESTSKAQGALVVGLTTLLVFYSASTLNGLLATHTAIQIGSDPGVSDATMLRLGAPISLLMALAVWRWRTFVFNRRLVTGVAAAGAAMFIVQNSYTLGKFYVSPSFEARSIRANLSDIITSDATLAGDWAPFFALGTDIKALYMNRDFNAASRVLETKPDYFLYSETDSSDVPLRELRGVSGLSIGDPIYRSHYGGKAVILYPLQYD